LTDELEFNEEAEILFDLFCEELDTRKSLEAADGVKITQKEWSFFIVHCSDLHVFSFCSHSFKSFKILLSSFYNILVYFLSTKVPLCINLRPSDSAKKTPFLLSQLYGVKQLPLFSLYWFLAEYTDVFLPPS